MKLAQINLTRGTHIPGLGERVRIDKPAVVAESDWPEGLRSLAGSGLLIETTGPRVLIPWARIESIVTDWVDLRQGTRGETKTAAAPSALPADDRQVSVAAAQAQGNAPAQLQPQGGKKGKRGPIKHVTG